MSKRSKAARKVRIEPIPLADYGTAELRQHHEVELEGTGRPHARVLQPFDVYARKGELGRGDERLNGIRYLAGCRLRDDWAAARVPQRVIANLEPGRNGRGEEFPDWRIAAIRRRDDALRAIGGAARPLLEYVVCEGGSASGWMHDSGYARNPREAAAGLTYLIMGLDTLARHYRLTSGT